jgi:hypothetical protein
MATWNSPIINLVCEIGYSWLVSFEIYLVCFIPDELLMSE